MCQRVGDVCDDARGLAEVRPVLLEPSQQALAPEQRGDDVALFAFDSGIEYGDDARMLQAGKLAGFLDECLVAFGRAEPSGVEHLDRDRTLELGIETLVHGREPASTNRTPDLIAAEPARSRRAWCFRSRLSVAHGSLRNQSAGRRKTICGTE